MLVPGDLLKKIDSPADLKKLKSEQLIQLSNELRQYIIDVVSSNPAHFGASLGVVELTVALHYVYNLPYDKLIWDVGHQAYGHKILSGRRDNFDTNRKYKGISGFPSPKESEYDAFGVGHSSTSISAALGMAVASSIQDEKRNVIAIIGDGSMTAGQAFEGLNNAGMQKSNLLVILNDNNIAIDQNVGALHEYLIDITTSKTYNKVKKEIWDMLGKLKKIMPNSQHFVQKIENGMKSIILKQSNLFEALNFRYFGPVDGHDVLHLTKVLEDLKHIEGPKLLHCITQKGKGFKYAEMYPTTYHATSKVFNKHTGEFVKEKNETPHPPKYQEVFGNTLLELAKANPKIVGVTPAMSSGCSLNIMMKAMPERSFDVGIAEQHAVTFSAGLAIDGLIPYCNIYSTFMQRAYDQVIHDVALQKLNVVLCLDRGGVVGADGATHHGAYDLAYMRCIPDIIISAPMNEQELRNLMFTAQLENKGAFVIRYPRGEGVMLDWKTPFEELEIGKGQLVKEGEDIAILTIGTVGNFAKKATQKLENEGFSIAHYDMRFLKPLDEIILHTVCKKFKQIISIEDGTIVGGLGTAVMEFINDNDYCTNVKRLGIPDSFVEHGTQQELHIECGYDSEGIYQTAKQLLAKIKAVK